MTVFCKRCPLCDIPWSASFCPDQLSREKHVNACLDDFHDLNGKRRNDELRQEEELRFAKARIHLTFAYPSSRVLASSPETSSSTKRPRYILPLSFTERKRLRFDESSDEASDMKHLKNSNAESAQLLTMHVKNSNNEAAARYLSIDDGVHYLKGKHPHASESRHHLSNEKKRIRLLQTAELDLPGDCWRLVTRFSTDLIHLRGCSKQFRAVCERESLHRLAAKLWLRCCVDDVLSAGGRSFAVVEHLSRTNPLLDVVPCVNVSLQGRIRAHLIFVNQTDGFRQFAREWEQVTGLQKDRASFAICAGNVVSQYLSPAVFPSIQTLRKSGVFVLEKLPPLSPEHVKIHVRWRGLLDQQIGRYFGIPLTLALPRRGCTRRQVHAAVFERCRRFLRPVDLQTPPYTLLTLPLLEDEEDEDRPVTRPAMVMPCDSQPVHESSLLLVMDFGPAARKVVRFDDFFGKLSPEANARCVAASATKLLEGLVERDCGVRIMS